MTLELVTKTTRLSIIFEWKEDTDDTLTPVSYLKKVSQLSQMNWVLY